MVITDVSGQPSRPLPIGFPETAVMNYHYTLRNNPEERISHLLRDENTSRIYLFLLLHVSELSLTLRD